MRLIRVDECISWRIVDAIRALRLPSGVEIESAQHRGEQGQPDVTWIVEFAQRGGHLVISGDANMRHVQLERAALEASGLVAVFPSSKSFFDKLGKWGQAAYILAWMPAILRLLDEAPRGKHYRLPPSFTGEFDSLITLRSLAEIEAEAQAKADRRGKAEPEE